MVNYNILEDYPKIRKQKNLKIKRKKVKLTEELTEKHVETKVEGKRVE